MSRKRVRQLAAAAAAALLLGGAITAAFTAGGGSRQHAKQRQAAHTKHDLRVAAAYLGVSVAVLEAELRSGKTLAELAEASGRRGVGGLEAALLSAKRRHRGASEKRLSKRVHSEVNRAGGPAGLGAVSPVRSATLRRLFVRAKGLGRAAASYIGVPGATLRRRLETGLTLATVALSRGRSEQGLVDALSAPRRRRLAIALRKGAISARLEKAREQSLRRRIERLVNRSFARSPPH